MIEYVRMMLVAELEAALAMLNHCIEACPEEHWNDKIGNATFRWNAYHVLFFLDLYLSPSEHDFAPREFHLLGGDEREDRLSEGLSKQDTLAYVPLCRQKIIAAIATETAESLAGGSGFSWYSITRGEFHLNNIRHVQHHTGQMSAHLRRIGVAEANNKSLPWIGAGWR
jgi:DinB family protein